MQRHGRRTRCRPTAERSLIREGFVDESISLCIYVPFRCAEALFWIKASGGSSSVMSCYKEAGVHFTMRPAWLESRHIWRLFLVGCGYQTEAGVVIDGTRISNFICRAQNLRTTLGGWGVLTGMQSKVFSDVNKLIP